MKNNYNPLTPRESFLMSLLNKVTTEYNNILNYTRGIKPFKIVEIIHLSNIPGEAEFLVQITNKHSMLPLTAAELINHYNLNDFSRYHAELIKQAALGKLIEFLKLSDVNQPKYKIISKKFNKDIQQNVFIIEDNNQNTIMRTADEIAKDKIILSQMTFDDIHDIGYTQGFESIIKEKTALLLARSNR